MAGIFAGMCFGTAMKTSRTLTKSLIKRFQQPRARLDGLPETIALSAARGCIFANVRTKAMDQQTQTDPLFCCPNSLIRLASVKRLTPGGQARKNLAGNTGPLKPATSGNRTRNQSGHSSMRR
jgi:hypothetical protein